MTKITLKDVIKDVEDLKNQNIFYFENVKEVNRLINNLETEIKNVRNLNNTINHKIQHDYEKLKRIILDENISITLKEEIKNTNEKLSKKLDNAEFENYKNNNENYKNNNENDKKSINEQLDTKANENEVVKKGEGTLNDFDEKTRALLQGLPEGETNINAVLGEENVTTFNLSKDVAGLFTDVIDSYISLTSGSIRDSDGQLVGSSIRVRSNLAKFNTGDIITSTNFKFYILKYDSSGVFQGLLQSFTNKYRFTTNEYVRIVIGKNDDSDIMPNDVLGKINITKPNLFDYSNKKIDENIKNSVDERTLPLITTTLNEGKPTIGSINTTDGTNLSSTTRARTNELLKFSAGDTVKCSTNKKFYGIEYTKEGVFIKVLFNFTNSYTFESECYIKFTFAYNDNQTITDVEGLANLITVQSANNFNYSNAQIEKIINIHQKILEGKIWAVVGDSTTDSNVHTALKYHYWVAQDTGITVLDFGKSGTGYKRTEEKGTAFYQRVSTIPSNVDVVTIFGLGNDCSQSYTVGEVTDNTTDTWCGCVNKTIDTILERCPICNIALVSPYQWGIYPTSSDNKMKELSNKLKEIAEYRGFEFLDLYRQSSVRPNDATFNNTYFYDGDKVHLNEEGHKKFLYPKFKQLILGMTNTLV